jgi:hypothetical protein
MRGRVERAARKFRRQVPGVANLQPTTTKLSSVRPNHDQCSRNPDGIEAGQPSHHGNHETDYVGEPKRQAGVDKVGNWRNEGQVLPLCRLRRGLAVGAGARCLSDSTGRFVLRQSAE